MLGDVGHEVVESAVATVTAGKRRYKKKKTVSSEGDGNNNPSTGVKRKRSVPGKLKQMDNAAILHRAPSGKKSRSKGYDMPLKRPRGRPPLGAKSFLGLPTKILGLNGLSSSGRGFIGSRTSMDSSSARNSRFFYPPDPLPPVAMTVDTDSGKIQRPHASLVTHRILTRLMTEGPLHVADLTGNASDGPTREVVQSIWTYCKCYQW